MKIQCKIWLWWSFDSAPIKKMSFKINKQHLSLIIEMPYIFRAYQFFEHLYGLKIFFVDVAAWSMRFVRVLFGKKLLNFRIITPNTIVVDFFFFFYVFCFVFYQHQSFRYYTKLLDFFIRFRDNLGFTGANIIYCDFPWTKYKIRMRMFSNVLVESRYVNYHNFTIKSPNFKSKTWIGIL